MEPSKAPPLPAFLAPIAALRRMSRSLVEDLERTLAAASQEQGENAAAEAATDRDEDKE
jgi:hypothetical protein